MSNEAKKTTALWGNDVWALIKGQGLDIGAGSDPITADVRTFDKSDGDANRIDEYIYEKFDFVFSSHCLEHMLNPWDALSRWWKLVKPQGHLIVIVPDEDLYEQGWWPSLFNQDHKYTFTLNEQSWSPVSVNVNDLIRSLPNAEIVAVSHHTHAYDLAIYENRTKNRRFAIALMWLSKKLTKLSRLASISFNVRLPHWLGVPIDQTAHGALAQIQFIIRKRI